METYSLVLLLVFIGVNVFLVGIYDIFIFLIFIVIVRHWSSPMTLRSSKQYYLHM